MNYDDIAKMDPKVVEMIRKMHAEAQSYDYSQPAQAPQAPQAPQATQPPQAPQAPQATQPPQAPLLFNPLISNQDWIINGQIWTRNKSESDDMPELISDVASTSDSDRGADWDAWATYLNKNNSYFWAGETLPERKHYTAEDYPKIKAIDEKLTILERFIVSKGSSEGQVTVKWLKDLRKEILDLREWYNQVNRVRFNINMDMGIYSRTPPPFSEDIRRVDDALEILIPEYSKDVGIAKGDIIHGYKMEWGSDRIRFSYDDFVLYRGLWKPSHLSFEEFYNLYDRNTCTEWSKADRHGECYGGFWKYPEGSYERENAWTLSHEDNGKALWDLPYPRIIILTMLKVACAMRMDSVPDVVFFCEWLRRKIAQIPIPQCIQIQRFWRKRHAKRTESVTKISGWWKPIYYRPGSKYYSGVEKNWIKFNKQSDKKQ